MDFLFLYDSGFSLEAVQAYGDEISRQLDGSIEIAYADISDADAWKGLACDGCIYFVPFDSGVTRTQCEPIICNNNTIRHWLIFMIPNEFSNTKAQNIVKRKWEQALFDVDAAIQIITSGFDSSSQTLEWIKSELAFFDIMGKTNEKESICAVVSSRSRAGKTELIRLLEQRTSAWKFIEIDASNIDEYNLLKEKVSKIIIVGTDIHDFALEPPSDGMRRVLFLLNKTDEQLLFRLYPSEIKYEICEWLGKHSWPISQESQDNIMTGSVLYAQLYFSLSEDISSVDEIVANPGFVMWDAYGLPVSRALDKNSILSFLSENHGINDLLSAFQCKSS